MPSQSWQAATMGITKLCGRTGEESSVALSLAGCASLVAWGRIIFGPVATTPSSVAGKCCSSSGEDKDRDI